MTSTNLELPATVHSAFATFQNDASCLALPLTLTADNNTLQPLTPIRPKDPTASFQNALNELDSVLTPRTPLYLLLRRNNSLLAITFVPYLARVTQRDYFLENRHELVRQLGGEKHFSVSLICKEIGEITDARSWEERDGHVDLSGEGDDCSVCEMTSANMDGERGVKDEGYKKNKCRLCDRRMKNKIAPAALDALKTLRQPGAVVQMHVDISTDTLTLLFAKIDVQPHDVSALLPTTQPTFTFYNHPTLSLLYFIFHSPDTSTVQSRMKHTMAIPGLINVHAEDQGVHVDQKIEIHEPGELVFEERDGRDGRVGKYRSLWLREGFRGTEKVWGEGVP